jgi:hypothetical protein
MLERLTPAFRIVCMLLVGLVCFQISRIVMHKNPLDDLKIPASAYANVSQPAAQPKSTNSAAVKSTNSPSIQTTNSATNAVAPQATNSVARSATNTPSLEATNSSSRRATSSSSRRSSSSGATLGSPSGSKDPNLSPAVQARIDKIVQSEILGAIVRPLPMALLGVAGRDAFIRAPNGQTGLVREGEEFGGLKLLRIDINRVLIEHEGQQKELTLFQGLGSETLLPRGDKKPSETTSQPQP